ISPHGHFVVVTAGSRFSFAEPFTSVYEVSSGIGHGVDPMPMRPWMAVVDDSLCPAADDACDWANVVVSGEPWEAERYGVVLMDLLHDGQWSGSSEFTLPTPLQVTESCGEVLLSGIGGASTVSGLGALSPAILGKDPPPVVLCTNDNEWVVVEEDGTVLRSPTLRQPNTTATGIDVGSWYVTEFAETEDILADWPDDPSLVRLRPEPNGRLAVVVDGKTIAESLPPTGRVIDDELTVVASIPFDESTLTTSDYEVSVALSGLDWSREVTIRTAGGGDSAEPLWSGTFPDAPYSLLLMSDGTVLGLFTYRGDYYTARWIAYSDDHLVRLACGIGAIVPEDVIDALALDSTSTPAACTNVPEHVVTEEPRIACPTEAMGPGLTVGSAAPGLGAGPVDDHYVSSVVCGESLAAVGFVSDCCPDNSLLRLYDMESGDVVATIGMPYAVPAFVLDCLGVSAADAAALDGTLQESTLTCDRTQFDAFVAAGTITE
ncbi:MAG: hypothetical protein AB7Q27_22865, partial [Acidimicrobiia bacterium]